MGQGNEFPFCLLEGDFLVKKKKALAPFKKQGSDYDFHALEGASL